MTASFLPDVEAEIRHFHMFCGIGGGGRGFNRGHARLGQLVARYRCIGGIDVSASAVAAFERGTGARGTALDLFDVEQYRAFHGKEPPADWREATADDIRRAAGGERPHIVFTSPPCKGFSGLLSETRSNSARYQALNRLTLRGVGLALEAWADDPPEFFLLENVPRIATRGRPLLDDIVDLLEARNYAVAETAHDCGVLGGLAQSRRRFLLVARHREKVPPFLYEPPKKRLRAVGEVVGAFPFPGDPRGGPMHRMRQLEWRTWVRLAFVEAGGDWRSLQKLRVADGHLVDFGIEPDTAWHRGVLGVTGWDEPAGTITSEARPGQGRFAVADPRAEAWDWAEGRRGLGVVDWNEPAGAVTGQARAGQGAFSVADPRVENSGEYGQLGVKRWEEPASAISGQALPGGGRFAVADPRLQNRGPAFNNVFRVVRWGDASPAVTGPGGAGTGLSVADPRAPDGWDGRGKYRVTAFEKPAGAVIGASTTGNGAFAVADPRPGLPADGPYQTAGHFGVVPWDEHTRAVTGTAGHDNGPFNVADPRCPAITPGVTPALPVAAQRLVAVIRALDGTWHRPFTTLELAALQSLVTPGEPLTLEGTSDSAWREWIGNAVPPDAAEAIACEMGRALLLAWSGQTFALGATPIWVRPLVIAMAVDIPRLP